MLVFSKKSTLPFKFSKLDKQMLMLKLLRSMPVSRALTHPACGVVAMSHLGLI